MRERLHLAAAALLAGTPLLLLSPRGAQDPASPAEPVPGVAHAAATEARTANPAEEPASTAAIRPFRMGFTSWPCAPTPDGVAETYRLIGESGDLIVQHIEGVPWTEAADGAPFPKAFQDGLDLRRRLQPKGAKLLLSLSPLNMGRNALGGPENAPVPDAFRKRAFNDPAVRTAYRQYVVRMVRLFQPDWLLTGIESNELLGNVPAAWPAYLELSRETRAAIQREFPGLPVAESVTLHKLADTKNPALGSYREEVRAFAGDHDFLAVSFYPMFLGMHTREAFDGALASLRERGDKPVAMVECGHPAEPVEAKSWSFSFPSTPEEQDTFVQALLARAQSDRYLLVSLWAVKDFDALWETFPDAVKDLGRLWRDTGLYDEKGAGRPALATWREALARPYRR